MKWDWMRYVRIIGYELSFWIPACEIYVGVLVEVRDDIAIKLRAYSGFGFVLECGGLDGMALNLRRGHSVRDG
jgi:hypothetical protein